MSIEIPQGHPPTTLTLKLKKISKTHSHTNTI
jgi:hypothetical protein